MKKKTISTKAWIIVIGSILVLCAGFTAYLLWPRPILGPVAKVYQNGVLMYEVDLGRVKESYIRTYPGADGAENIVEFAPGQVRMEHSTCPDQVCVGMGWQDGSWILPIACLPNNVTVWVTPAEDAPETGIDSATK